MLQFPLYNWNNCADVEVPMGTLSYTPHPLRMHRQNQKNKGQTGSPSGDKAVHACDSGCDKANIHQKPAHTSPNPEMLLYGCFCLANEA